MPNYISKRTLTAYQAKMILLMADLEAQKSEWKASSGDTREAYRKTILDKCYKLNRVCGEFYHKQLETIGNLELEMAGLDARGETLPSDTSVAHSESDP